MEYKILLVPDGIKQSFKCGCAHVHAISGSVLLMYERHGNPHAIGGDWISVSLARIKGLPK
jgi:hypothetical protein